MGIGYNRKTRRQFLHGLGKTMLLLPVLPSLLPRDAWAQATVAQKRLMILGLMHSAADKKWLSPSLAATAIGAKGAKQIALSTLANANLPILSNAVYSSLRTSGRMTILNGLDNMVDTAGHGQLGSAILSGSLEYPMGNQFYPGGYFPSIDTAMEASSTLFPAATTPAGTTKILRASYNDQDWFNLTTKKVGSNYSGVPGFSDPLKLYNSVFAALTGTVPTPTPTPAPTATPTPTPVPTPTPTPGPSAESLKKAILNQVYSSYQSVMTGRKISADDKARLDEHMQNLSDLSTKFAAASTSGVSTMSTASASALMCAKPTAPASGLSYVNAVPITFNLMALAFKCGLTKVGTFSSQGHGNLGIPGLPAGGYHNDVVHGPLTEAQKFAYYEIFAKFHTDAFADNFLATLNVEEAGTGRTYLDNMITGLHHELGLASAVDAENHPQSGHMVVLLGSMGGYIKTDRMISYGKPGLPYNSLLVTYLQAMGLSATEYEAYSGSKGWGPYGPGGSTTPPATYANFWGNQLYSPISELFL